MKHLKMTDIDHRISEPAGEWFFKIQFVRFFFLPLRHDGSKEYKQHPDRQISTDGLLVVWGCGQDIVKLNYTVKQSQSNGI